MDRALVVILINSKRKRRFVIFQQPARRCRNLIRALRVVRFDIVRLKVGSLLVHTADEV